ncbi:MAG: hypothetical protein P0Y56_00565 [Candidatus Andeanibacterium colombiense]|uniref:TonB C-terminal domain-containing protein n=1 Tax=Candidatus Andeanibacterium colombiense TaxID=3121345 RepID=A0AAJ5X315_9SPHN|nr:MAG: hypothetical protein P0Y56_00565 [Sphingomonadaceae bacterium]
MSTTVLLSMMAASLAVPSSGPTFTQAAMAARGSGVAVVELFVSPEREVLDCKIVNSELFKKDNERICDSLRGKRAAKAAVGPDGKPSYGALIYVVAGSDAAQANSLKPNLQPDVELDVASLPEGARSKTISLNVMLDESGKIARCEAANGSAGGFAKAACGSIDQKLLRVRKGKDGNAVAYVKTITVDFVSRQAAL